MIFLCHSIAGSFNTDKVLLSHGFVGEAIKSGAVLVYKAHLTLLRHGVSSTLQL